MVDPEKIVAQKPVLSAPYLQEFLRIGRIYFILLRELDHTLREQLTMARTSKEKNRTGSAVTGPAKKARKKRVGNVKTLILKALKAGSSNRPALVKATGASYNALVMHLAKLKEEGLVAFDVSNRIVSLAGSSVSGKKNATTGITKKVALSKKPVAAPGLPTMPALIAEPITVPASIGYSKSHLKDAIEQFVRRIEPVKALDDKLMVLDHLSDQLGGPIAEVLADIKADLLRS